MLESILTKLVRYSRTVMICNLLVLGGLALGASNLYLESGIKIFFSDNDPNLLSQEALEGRYGKPDNILIVLDAGGSTVFSNEHLAALEQLTIQAWQTPYSRRVDSIINYQHPSVADDDILIEELVADASNLSQQDLVRIRDIALGESALVGRLIAADGHVAAVNILLNLPEGKKAASIAEAVSSVRQMIEDTALPATIDIHLAGWALTEQSLAEVTATDGATLMPLLFIVVLVLLAALLRSISASLLTLVAIFLSVMQAQMRLWTHREISSF